jgi:hypothetical protein
MSCAKRSGDAHAALVGRPVRVAAKCKASSRCSRGQAHDRAMLSSDALARNNKQAGKNFRKYTGTEKQGLERISSTLPLEGRRGT